MVSAVLFPVHPGQPDHCAVAFAIINDRSSLPCDLSSYGDLRIGKCSGNRTPKDGEGSGVNAPGTSVRLGVSTPRCEVENRGPRREREVEGGTVYRVPRVTSVPKFSDVFEPV